MGGGVAWEKENRDESDLLVRVFLFLSFFFFPSIDKIIIEKIKIIGHNYH